jgi:hypothetical protein
MRQWTPCARLAEAAGFRQITGIDINGMRASPSQDCASAYKRPEQAKWYPGETISLGMVRGYNTFTMLRWRKPQPCWPTTASSTSRAW